MAIKNVNGHGVSTAAPAHHQEVTPANVQFQQAPAHQSGGMGGPSAKGKPSAKKNFPPAY